KSLVVFQFSIAIMLMISTLFFYLQLDFIKNKKLGFNPEQVVTVRVQGIRSATDKETVRKEFLRLSSVKNVALSQTFPSKSGSGRSIYKINEPDENGKDLTTCRADSEILKVLDIKLLAGRHLKNMEEGDTIAEVILNESAVDYLGTSPDEAIGQIVDANLQTSVIVGVCEDFHAGSMHQQIGNYAFHNRATEWLSYLLVKVTTDDLGGTLQQLRKSLKQVAPTVAFEYAFIDESVNRLYAKEEQLAQVVFWFAGLTIFIACLGLFALAAYATERRTKEIGIRKVLGASIGNIVGLLSKEFLYLVGISLLIAIPLAWLGMQRWLNDFAYRIDMEWWVFAVAGLLAVLIAFITVSFQSVKAALSNPIEAINLE
ncbi:MAG: FtsX-like permease family protein, partial [Bacteroidota bacterium]